MDTNIQVTNGMTVRGSDGDKVGKIVEVSPTYIVVEKGFFFPSDHYIPTSAISSVGDDEVFLSVTKDEALGQGWDRQPADWNDAATGTSAEALRVPVYEEDITAVKRDVERGAVRIEKELVTEDRTVTVPVTEERVRVTRVDANDPGAVGADAFEEGVIEVPVRGEEVGVDDQTVDAGYADNTTGGAHNRQR